MELEDYLRKIKTCSDDKLTRECGVRDNWPIFVTATYEQTVDMLANSGKFNIAETFPPYKKSPRITILGYALDIVTAAVWDHSRKQEEPILYLGEYPTQIMLHQ
ncbi:MAG: hypothetical protein ABIF10_02880, partial [Candidatus Woesearchaeota archaeon]